MTTHRLAAPLLVCVLALAGCGSGGDDSSTKVTQDSGGTSTIDITFKDGKVTPEGAKVQVEKGKPVKLHITADEAGEVHVHSEPEQEIAYAKGTTDKSLTLDQPGVVDVESHDLDKLIVQLEVR